MPKIFIYGDSHAIFSFKRLTLFHENHGTPSVTMHRIGRDKYVVNAQPAKHQSDSTVVVCYGEVDCRCHVQRQIDQGRLEDEVLRELADAYFATLDRGLSVVRHVVVVGIIPPTECREHEAIHGPITHAFPFVGTDTDRARYTAKMNRLLEEHCRTRAPRFVYFNPYLPYTRPNGCLRHEYSDTNVHLGDNAAFLRAFENLMQQLGC